MSDLDLLRQLEISLGKKINKFFAKDFQAFSDSTQYKNNFCLLSNDGKVIILCLKNSPKENVVNKYIVNKKSIKTLLFSRLDLVLIGRFRYLQKLIINRFLLTNISCLGELTELTSLDLTQNKISDISFLQQLTKLNSINLSKNQIREIPYWLAEKKLNIKINNKNNQSRLVIINAKEVSQDLEYNDHYIDLSDNPIERPPIEVVKQGNEAIRNYYSQLEIQGEDYLYEAKMLIVGEGEAGKTTLARKIEDINCPLPEEDDRTRGISINPHTFSVRAKNEGEYRRFDLNVWDFGGQEIYHATHRFFLSKRSLYVLVADNRKDNTDFNYWLNIIELFAEDSPIIIVLNEKDDLQRTVNISELRSRYPDSLKEILPVNFKTQEEPDSNKRQQRLKDLKTLLRHIEHYANCLPHIGEPVPARWVYVRQAIETDTRDYISRQDFDTICHEKNITNFQDINTLLGYFHDLGIVLHFADHPFLCDRVILKPTWATDAIYRLFDDDGIKAKQGRFTREDCTNLWSDRQYQYMQNTLIELMKKFRLVYEIEQTSQLVAPQMLPPNTPDYSWDNTNNSLMQFRYDVFMPKGIFWQFVVTMYRYIEDHRFVWKNGVILQYKGTRAEIIENLFDRRIYIRFSGKNIEQLRSIVAFQLDEISESYHKLKYEKMIPCNCRVCGQEKEPHFYEFTDLETRIQRGKQTVECRKSYDDVPVTNLLKGFDFSSQAIDRRELLNLLTNLVKEQFNDILFEIDPPAGIVPSSPASQSDRAHKLLEWAESPTGCKLGKIQAALKRILPESIDTRW